MTPDKSRAFSARGSKKPKDIAFTKLQAFQLFNQDNNDNDNSTKSLGNFGKFEFQKYSTDIKTIIQNLLKELK